MTLASHPPVFTSMGATLMSTQLPPTTDMRWILRRDELSLHLYGVRADQLDALSDMGKLINLNRKLHAEGLPMPSTRQDSPR